MAAPNLTEQVVTTARNYLPGLADQITNHNSFARWAKSNGLFKPTRGGRTIVRPLIHGTNDSVQWYDGYDTFTPPTTSQAVDGSEWNWKQLGGFVAISGKEKKMNYGEHQRIDLIKARIKQLRANLMNTFSTSLFSDGTGSAGKELGGLQLLIDDDPTSAGTVGGINQVTNTFWRNQYSAAATTSSTNIGSRMNAMWLSTIRGSDKPGLVVADSVMYTYYWDSLTANQRFTTSESAQLGFGTLKYQNALVEYDPACPAKHMYFVDPDSIEINTAPGSGIGFEVGDARQVSNADYEVVPVFFMGAITVDRRAGMGVIIDD